MNMNYEDGTKVMTASQRTQLAAAVAGNRGKISLRDWIVAAFGEEVVLELNWTGSAVSGPAGSLVTYLEAQRQLSKLFANGRFPGMSANLLGSGVIRIQEEDNDHYLVDTDRTNQFSGTSNFDSLVGSLVEFFPTEDDLRAFVEGHMKLVKAKVTYDDGIVEAIRSLCLASIARRRFGRLLQKIYENKASHDFLFTATVQVYSGMGLIQMRNGGQFKLA